MGVSVNWDNCREGRPSKGLLATLVRSVAQYKWRSASIKIGITSNPERRAREYDGWEYDEMVVLYKTSRYSNDNFVRELERELVDKHWEDCDNSIGGGGGPLGKPPYYLYIVRYF